MAGSDYTDNFDNDGFDHKLKAELFRFHCPTPLQLGDYYCNLQAPDVKQEIAHHLKTCPHCREEYEYLKEFIITPSKMGKTDKPDTVEEPGADAPGNIIPFKRQIPGEETFLPLANVRSTADEHNNRKVTFKINAAESLVLFYEIGRENKEYSFTGQFVTDEQIEESITGAMVEIWQDNTIRTTCQVDNLCTFRFKLAALTPVIMRIINAEGTFLSAELNLKAD